MSISTYPRFVILPCRDELMGLRSVLCELDMPAYDLQKSLTHIVAWGVSSEADEFVTDLVSVSSELAADGTEFEDIHFDNGGSDRAFYAWMEFGKKMRNKFQELRAYHDGRLLYSFTKLLNEDTLLFTKQHE